MEECRDGSSRTAHRRGCPRTPAAASRSGRTLDQPPARIVNQALAEFLERRLRPDRSASGSTSSYIEMTAREEHDDVF
jgi:hypothetical protein